MVLYAGAILASITLSLSAVEAGLVRTRQASPQLTFTDCPNIKPFRPVNATFGLQCANMSVPMSYDQPDGPQIQLGIVKLKAKPGGNRIGNLFVNPGGPGGAASTQVVQTMKGLLPMGETILQSFDIIGMDPRGVGLSTPIRCDTGIGNEESNFDASTPDGFQKLFAYNQRLGASCRNMTGPLFDNMDTILVAKDMEAVRVAMGGEPMNYFGLSYGTQLGAQYAALFPDKVRAMALDGILQHTGAFASNVHVQTVSLDRTIQAFFTACETNQTNCGPGGQNVRQAWASVIQKASESPLIVAECDGTAKTGCFPKVTVSDMLGGARQLLEVPGRFRSLAQGILLAADGNATVFANGLLSGDTFTDSGSFAIQNVQCQDGHFIAATDATQVQELATMTRTFAITPGMGEFWNRVITCTGYPTKITNPRTALSVKGTQNPVLLVHSRFDPATSLVYAQGMLEEIQNSTLLFRDGLGHTSYFIQGDTAKAMDDYLVNLKIPESGTVLKT